MCKTLLLAVVLLTLVAWSQAQQAPPSPDEGKPPVNPSGLTTLNGCLHYDDGQYWLIDADNTKHRLSGYGKQLKQHIGHEVELTGKPSSRTIDNTPPGGASSAITQYVFEVKGVKRTADLCKSQ
jgi:hypothetical protein